MQAKHPKKNGGRSIYPVNTMEQHRSKMRASSPSAGLHPIDRGLAKHWTKQRLVAVFPELRSDRQQLELAYRALDLQPTFGGDGGSELVFEMRLHSEA